jgi:hypothetical protein
MLSHSNPCCCQNTAKESPRIAVDKPDYIRKKTWERELTHVQEREKLESGTVEGLNYLYQRLSILDDKVAGLLTLNSILLAAVSFGGSQLSDFPWARQLLLWGAMPAWLASTIICLSISFLKWEGIHNHWASLSHYKAKVIKVTVRRTFLYNIAVALILILIVGAGIWAGIGIYLKSSHDRSADTVSLTVSVADQQIIPEVSTPGYAFERFGAIGPFEPGKDQVAVERTTNNYITIQQLVRDLTIRSSNGDELVFLILAGKADKRELNFNTRKRYGSNLTLAQRRASSVKQQLTSEAALHLANDKILTIITGADILDNPAKNNDGFEPDRVVECYALFKKAPAK